MARAAMENLDGVERLMMSGLRATLVLEKDAQLTEADVKRVLADEKLKFESFAKQVVPPTSPRHRRSPEASPPARSVRP